ncbi:hypothetical protein SDC9_57094 [bioreactor metagenome]|uniref:Uncharacterized protein n=1 Tax=bioreactor metagenome TaxID=1076179 RepID=A0A644X3N2_9ZZZZ
MPIPRSFLIAAALLAFTVSATAMMPANSPSIAMYIGVLPCSASVWEVSANEPSPIACFSINFSFPSRSSFPSIVTAIPKPGSALKADGFNRDSSFSSASRTIASPSGCSDPFSADAASSNSSSGFSPSRTSTSVTFGFPSVIVPVLSKTIVWILCVTSRAVPLLISTPFSAPLPVPTMMAVGVAKPNAQGQAMTKTDIVMVSAKIQDSCPKKYQASPAKTASTMTIGTK